MNFCLNTTVKRKDAKQPATTDSYVKKVKRATFVSTGAVLTLVSLLIIVKYIINSVI